MNEKNKSLLRVCAYLGPLALVSWWISEDEDVLCHARQGLLLFFVECFCMLVLALATKIWIWLGGGKGVLLAFLVWSVWIVAVGILHLYLVVKAWEGKKVALPLLHTLAKMM